MRNFKKYLVGLGLSILTTMSLAFNADAQRGGRGGGFRGGGGFGFHGGGGFRGGGGFGGGARIGGGFNRGGFAPRSNYGVRPNFGGRFGVMPRGGYAYRGGISRPGFGGWGNHSYFYGRPYYRGGVRGFYGRPYGGLYYNYRGYYNSYYYPRIGVSIGVLPYGYYPFYWGNNQYYYSNGFYYQQYNNQYTVVEPPVGAEINQLPDDAEPITIDGQQYYESNGVYYLPITKPNGRLAYRVAGKDGELNTQSGQYNNNGQYNNGNNNGSYNNNYNDYPQVGDVIDELPEDSRKVKVDGQKYYVTPDGIYLQQQRNADGKVIYVVTSVPGDEDNDQ